MSELLFDKKILFQIDKPVYNFDAEGTLYPEVGKNLIIRPLSLEDYNKGSVN